MKKCHKCVYVRVCVCLCCCCAVSQSSSNSWTITLSSKLRYSHEASGYIWAEVVLLDRQIVIQGLDEPSPNQNDGMWAFLGCTRSSKGMHTLIGLQPAGAAAVTWMQEYGTSYLSAVLLLAIDRVNGKDH